MKKVFLALALVAATSFTTFAQDETGERNRPVAGSIGFTFGVNNIFSPAAPQWFNNNIGLNNSLLFRYYLADDLAARAGISYTRSGDTDISIPSEGIETTVKSSNSNFILSLGAQKSLGTSNKLEPYIGADLLFGRGSSSAFSRTEVTAAAGGTVGDFTEVDINGVSTTSVGLVPVVGFNYYFTKNFAIGAEFGWGYIASFTGGGSTTVSSRSGTTNTSDTVENVDKVRTGDFGNFGSGSLAISVFF